MLLKHSALEIADALLSDSEHRFHIRETRAARTLREMGMPKLERRSESEYEYPVSLMEIENGIVRRSENLPPR